jgi:arylsulfatase
MGGGFVLAARVGVAAGAEGILCALGDWNNGFAWYLLDGRPVLAVSLFGDVCRVAAETPVSAGDHVLSVTYRRQPEGGGSISLAVDDVVVAEGRLPSDLPFRWQIAGGGLLVGRDRGLPVSDDYWPPFPFTGTLHELTVESGAARAPAPRADGITAVLRHE